MKRIKRFSRFRFYFINILLFIVILAVGCVLFSVYFCQLDSVVVKGGDIYSAKEIEKKLLKGKYDDNTVFAFVKGCVMPHKKIEFVKSYSMSIRDTHTLVIRIKQEDIHGYVTGDAEKYVYYDSSGYVVANTGRFVPDIFYVNGLTAKDAKPKEELPVGSSNVKTILTIQEELTNASLDVNTIDFSDDGTISFDVGAIHINLGTRKSLTDKIRRLPYILTQLDGQVGTLHLEEWSEDNTDIVFEKNQ